MSVRNHDDDWDEEEGPDGDDDFDYDEYIANEFGDPRQQHQHSPWIRIVAILLLLTLVVITFAQLGF